MVWIVVAVMTGAAVLCVVWPLSKPRSGLLARRGDDLQFYQEQMRAIDRDLDSGLVSSQDIAGSRAEIGRRLIAAAEQAGPAEPASGRRRRLFTAAVVVTVLVPALSLALYVYVGAPEMRDAPLAARLQSPDPNDISADIARIESHLANHPEDGRGFALIAPIYQRLGRYPEAAHAYESALAILGESAERRAALGETLTIQADGVVTADAKAAFDKALADDPQAPQPRYFLGLAAEQDGDKPRARDLWTKLAAGSPADAPWLPLVRSKIAALDGTSPEAAPLPPPATPAGASIAALPADQRLAAIHGMVDGLATRLQQNGQDKDGWLRLVRAYTVLGEKDKALGALADARKNLATDAQGLVQLEGLAHELGLDGQG